MVELGLELGSLASITGLLQEPTKTAFSWHPHRSQARNQAGSYMTVRRARFPVMKPWIQLATRPQPRVGATSGLKPVCSVCPSMRWRAGMARPAAWPLQSQHPGQKVA